MQTFILNAKDKNRPNVLANLHRFADALPESKSWEWTCKRYVKARSNKQNAGLWAVAYGPLAEFTGYREPELHDTMCRLFFGETAIEMFGKTVTRPRRTTTTNEDGKRDVIPWDEFCRFYAMVQQHGSENGIFIPDPDKNWRAHKKEE